MRVGIYNRYWNTRGGGERYAGSVAETLARRFDVDLIGVEPVDVSEVSDHLGLSLAGVGFRQWPARGERELTPFTTEYDLLINSTVASRLRSRARSSAYVVLFPQKVLSTAQARAVRRLQSFASPLSKRLEDLRAARDAGFLDDYQTLIAISEYVRGWTTRRWHRPSELLAPPIDTRLFAAPAGREKSRVILSVGRFFRGGHNKKHLRMVKAFRRMCDRGLLPDGWRLHLAGNLQRTHLWHYEYYAQIRSLARGYPVRLLPDLSLDELREEYRRAAIFWHATGWGESERYHPEKLEHFGLVTCEAMSAGCVPVVIAKAGQVEIVDDGVSGFLFRSQSELIDRTLRLVRGHGEPWREEMTRESIRASRRYDREVFAERLLSILERNGLIS